MAERLKYLKNQIIEYYNNFNFIKLIKEINKFIIDTSGFYLDTFKDILYANSQNSVERKMIQKNIYDILNTLLITLAPIMPTTCEEAYQSLVGKKESIHLQNFFKPETLDMNIEKE
jgi:isoleucyl-tRNA synthetase